MNKLKPFIFLLYGLTAFYACKNEDSPVVGSEAVTGYAYLHDIEGIRNVDNSGITVSMVGDSISTTTTSNGRWTLSHLKTGIYTFAFSNPGYGTMKVFEKTLAGGYQSVDTISLYPIPAYNITLSSATATAEYGIDIRAYFSGELPSKPCFHLFFGKDSIVSSDPANYIFDLVQILPGQEELINFQLAFLVEILKSNGFISRDTVYLAGYTDCFVTKTYNSGGAISYFDPNTNKKIYPNLNPTKSNVLKFLIP
jgi:hypothetical protein